MSARSAEPGLAELEASLEALISSLESEPMPSAVVLDSVWRRVQQGFEAMRIALAVDGPQREHQREPLERCQRLHVLATGLSVRRRGELAAEKQACTQLRTRLKAVRREGANGGSCDVSA